METKAWSKLSFQIPSRVPAMVSREERQYLYWLGSSVWSGQGAVVEIGPWLGGSTICLAAGMQASLHEARGRLRSIDAFIWQACMERWIPPPVGVGESFRELFLRNVDAHRQIVQAETIKLPEDGAEDATDDASVVDRLEEVCPNPVEILFIDGAKSWRGMRCVLLALCERLIPGASYIVCQDYKDWSYWVPMMMEKLGGSLAPAHDVIGGARSRFGYPAGYHGS